MKKPRYIYAIYPHDENGDYAGVYVGITSNVKRRLQIHLKDLYCHPNSVELHRLMKNNGYSYQTIDDVQSNDDTYLEYDWIDFFRAKTDLHIFNTKIGSHADFRNCKKGDLFPFFFNGGVAWQSNIF